MAEPLSPISPVRPAHRIALIGSGNWGSAIAKIVGSNVYRYDKFEKEVRMWVFEETLADGRKLSEVINETHENVKYLPGHRLPDNIVAEPSLRKAVAGATLLIFVLPHQFLPRLFADIRAGLHDGGIADLSQVHCISLIKGIDFDDKGLVLISDTIRRGLPGTAVSVLMGANVAGEVAAGQLCEATVGAPSPAVGELWRDVFDAPFFRISISLDLYTVELLGALKNVVALAAGFSDGLNYGGNTKAALMRIGLLEMLEFCRAFYPGTRRDGVEGAEGDPAGDGAAAGGSGSEGGSASRCVRVETLLESCGLADLITTCFAGRNRKCAEAFVRTGKGWAELEEELLGGQKLQGTTTAEHVHQVLESAGLLHKFPLFNAIYLIMNRKLEPAELVRMHHHVPREEHRPRRSKPAEGHAVSLALPPAARAAADGSAASDSPAS